MNSNERARLLAGWRAAVAAALAAARRPAAVAGGQAPAGP
jgi:hypothetical protein